MRDGAPGAFLLESVERGRLGRHSFVGRGSRIVGFDEAESLGDAGRRLPRLRRRHAPRADGAAARRPARASTRAASSCPSCSSASTTRAASPRSSSATPTRPRALLDGAAAGAPRGTGARGELRRFPERDEHLRRVERAKEHIREGDVFQVVIAQRAERPTSASAFELYRALRRVNPSPYLFLLELGDVALVGSSPETVVKCEGAPRRA